jgi:hypothetical protein
VLVIPEVLTPPKPVIIKPQKEPEVIYIDKKKPVMVDAGVDCNEDTEWINRDWIDID